MKEYLEEFLIAFGFDDKPLKEGVNRADKLFKGLSKTITGLFATFASAKIFNALTFDFANMNVELGKSTSLLGLNVEEVSALGGALERFGGNTDSAITSIKSLSGHLEQAKKGQGALIEVSRKYGLRVDPFASATDTLKSLGGQMGRFTNQQRLAISQQLGLDESLTRAFADGGKELDKYIQKQRDLGTTTQEDIDLSNKFNNAQLDLKDVFGALTRDFARVILPAFTKLVELFSSFIEWVRKHKQLVIIFFTGILIAMTPILIILGKMAIASAVAFAPFFIIGAVIAGVSLIIEDIYGYFMGWDSVTGDLVNKFPVLGTILEGFRSIVMGIAGTFGKIVDWLKDPTWENFQEVFKTAGETLVKYLVKPFEDFMSLFQWWLDKSKSVGSTIAGWLGFGDDSTAVPTAPAVPYQASTMNNQANNYNVNNNFNQNISTATPTQFANQTNAQITDSIYNIRQQNGAL